jgi:plasmid replication initiation protein
MAHNQLTKHEQLIAELDRQKQLQEDAPRREKAMELARQPVDISRYRNERNLMLYPFCSTAKHKRTKAIRYKSADGKRWIEVTANHDYGMAKIWDFDILRFTLSKAGEITRQVGYFPPWIDSLVLRIRAMSFGKMKTLPWPSRSLVTSTQRTNKA